MTSSLTTVHRRPSPTVIALFLGLFASGFIFSFANARSKFFENFYFDSQPSAKCTCAHVCAFFCYQKSFHWNRQLLIPVVFQKTSTMMIPRNEIVTISTKFSFDPIRTVMTTIAKARMKCYKVCAKFTTTKFDPQRNIFTTLIYSATSCLVKFYKQK